MFLGRKTARRGSVIVEAALIYPVLFLLILAIILLGLSVFRYQQVAHMSREASRWASVHGGAYAQENGTTPASAQDVFANGIVPYAAGLGTGGMSYTVSQDPVAGTITYTGVNADNSITYTITWNMDAQGNPDQKPIRTVQTVDPATGLVKDVAQYNTVTVTVTYSWNTGLFGTIPVSSTSSNTIFY
jgi:Flp pilus assembly protein TadG